MSSQPNRFLISFHSFHDLRHSYATGALKAGVSPKVVSQRIGHAQRRVLPANLCARTRQRRPRRRESRQRSCWATLRQRQTQIKMISSANVHRSVHMGHENGPRRILRGPFPLVAGTGFEPATSGLWANRSLSPPKRSVSYVQVNGVPSSSLFHHVALVRIQFTTFCSQIRPQHSKQKVQKLPQGHSSG